MLYRGVAVLHLQFQTKAKGTGVASMQSLYEKNSVRLHFSFCCAVAAAAASKAAAGLQLASSSITQPAAEQAESVLFLSFGKGLINYYKESVGQSAGMRLLSPSCSPLPDALHCSSRTRNTDASFLHNFSVFFFSFYLPITPHHVPGYSTTMASQSPRVHAHTFHDKTRCAP
jgi:hypothetical protein